MRNRFLYLILAFGLFTACINMNDPKQQAEYIKCYNSFDTSLVNLMPRKIPNNFLNMGYASLDFLDGRGFNKYAGMHIKTKIKDLNEYTELKNKYSSQAKSINKSTDSCLIIVSTYGQFEDGVQGSFHCNKPIPVPQYGICDANDSTNLWERLNDIEIIVLDYEFKDLLNRPDSKKRKDMPTELLTGYSKGITLNKNNLTIQKWVIVW
ncbi:hypothetical protein [Carboxylicivirga linearis]|uniref:Lipoprotein n=1 Tax=Carboxylicivirga linearis TaxID=1628157 RepID=A0ABS5JYV3_9BACT|nr:hypothetical protein [Carboxylicivirga linearis]MBS2100024.1 hypothetical protein [Carboxylicivirga linearis]